MARKHRPWVNAVVLLILRSPAHRLLSGSVCELSYPAPSDGRAVHLPVQYATHGDELVVLAADAPAKRWWRALATARPVTIRQAGRVWSGEAHVIHPDHPTSQPARAAYERSRHVRVASRDRLVLIDRTTTREPPCTSSPDLRSTSAS